MDLLGAVGLAVTSFAGVLGSIFNLNRNGHYVHWHFINISVANLVVIGLMLLAFLVALFLPFPGHRSKEGDEPGRD